MISNRISHIPAKTAPGRASALPGKIKIFLTTGIFPTRQPQRTPANGFPAGLPVRRGKSKRALPFGRLNEGMGSGEGGEIRNLPPPRSCLCLLSARTESNASGKETDSLRTGDGSLSKMWAVVAVLSLSKPAQNHTPVRAVSLPGRT